MYFAEIDGFVGEFMALLYLLQLQYARMILVSLFMLAYIIEMTQPFFILEKCLQNLQNHQIKYLNLIYFHCPFFIL